MRRLEARLDPEAGAVAILVAILLVVFIGITALVIDVGRLYEERRQLQNGADAGALALAADCANGSIVDCASASYAALESVAGHYADANAYDGFAAVPESMSHGTDPKSCNPGSVAALNPLAGTNSVKVTTETLDADENSFLTHAFAPILGLDTGTVRACAAAGWGAPGGATTIPLTFSFCEWDDMVETDPVTGEYVLPTDVETIYYHETVEAEANECNGPSGHDAPGGFGWLENDGECEADIESDQTVGTDTGVAVPNSCKDKDWWQDLIDEETKVLIPIFSEVTGTGNNAEYYIEGFAAFTFTGFRLQPGNQYASTPPPDCHPSTQCMEGRFVEYIEYGDHVDFGGDDFGAVVISLMD